MLHPEIEWNGSEPDGPTLERLHHEAHEVCFLRHGTMKVGLYAPRERDTQGPHKQDELYIVASGSGTFVKAGQTRPVAAGDILFVEAGVEHRFDTFSDDFSTWVVFWGPPGGEA